MGYSTAGQASPFVWHGDSDENAWPPCGLPPKQKARPGRATASAAPRWRTEPRSDPQALNAPTETHRSGSENERRSSRTLRNCSNRRPGAAAITAVDPQGADDTLAPSVGGRSFVVQHASQPPGLRFLVLLLPDHRPSAGELLGAIRFGRRPPRISAAGRPTRAGCAKKLRTVAAGQRQARGNTHAHAPRPRGRMARARPRLFPMPGCHFRWRCGCFTFRAT
jgi:hypothetical protein